MRSSLVQNSILFGKNLKEQFCFYFVIFSAKLDFFAISFITSKTESR